MDFAYQREWATEIVEARTVEVRTFGLVRGSTARLSIMKVKRASIDEREKMRNTRAGMISPPTPREVKRARLG